VVYPRILSELFYQCGVIDVIKAVGQENLLREIRASAISVNTLSNMHFLPGQVLIMSEPLEQLPHSGHSLVSRLKINLPSVTGGIVNQYIQLLENQGEAYEIEEEELKKKKRKRLVKAVEKSTTAKVESKGKVRTKAGSSKCVVIVDDAEDEDDNEPLRRKRKRISKELKKKTAESSTIAETGNVSTPKDTVTITQDVQNPPITNKPSESPLSFLEQHLQGELPPQPEPTTKPSDHVQNSEIIPDSEQDQNPNTNLNQPFSEPNSPA
jgi:hypothetical protein